MYKKYIKRFLDISCSLMVLIVFYWLYAIVAVLVRINFGSPILFIQERLGKDEKIFKVYKFRSMMNKCDENGKLLPDEQRLTKLERALRSTSLDMHLSGTLKEYLSFSPAYIMRYAAILLGKEHGFSYVFHGGGTSNAEDNSLYKFKKQFAEKTEFDVILVERYGIQKFITAL